MTFNVDIGKDGVRIPSLSRDEIQKAHYERCEAVSKVFEEAGADMDPSKVQAVEFDNGQKMAEWIRNANTEIDMLGKRMGELQEFDDIHQKADDGRRQGQQSATTFRAAPRGNGDDGGQKGGQRAQSKDLGQLVTGAKEYQEWVKNGAAGGISMPLDDLLPSDVLAKGVTPMTLGRKALFETTSGWAPESIRIPGFVEATARPVQVLDIMPMGETSFEQVVYMEETTRTHNAAETAEGGTYNESAFALTEKTSNVRKITDSVPVTDEQLEDVAQAESYLRERLTFGLRQRLDDQVVTGDGTGQNLTGIKNVSGINTQAKGDLARPDAFFKGMRQVRVTGRAMPTHHLIHPEDWEDIRLLKTADGVYMWGHPAEAGPERMWGLPVVQQEAESSGTGYVISAVSRHMSLFERRGVDVQVGFTGSQFVEGKRTIRGDMRWAFVVFRPAAITQVTGL